MAEHPDPGDRSTWLRIKRVCVRCGIVMTDYTDQWRRTCYFCGGAMQPQEPPCPENSPPPSS